jgi:signal transduction histidine kinase
VIDDEDVRGSLSAVAGNPTTALTVPARSHRVEFHYPGLGLMAPAKVRFQYWLEGFDPDWVEAGARRVAYYTRLSPGRYRFHVRACNGDGVWDETGVALGVLVLPAYFQTWWFRLLVVAAGIGLITAFYVSRLARLQALAKLRGRIAGDLHDEVGSNLGSIAVLSELSQREPALPKNVRRRLTQIHQVSRHTAAAIRDIVWFINPEFDTLDDMVARMREFAVAEFGALPYQFEAPARLPQQRLSLALRRNVFFAFKEMLHNLVKHAHATQARIRLDVTRDRLCLEVTDDGQGFEPALARTGHGLKSLRQRALDLGGRLDIQSQRGQGTTITLHARLR